MTSLMFVGQAVAQDEIPLFDGQTFNGWTTADGKPIGPGWEITGGVLHLNPGLGRGGQLVTEQEYADFDLRFEWRIAAHGNSGVKYRVRKYGNQILGCEYQMLDDESWGEKLKPKGMTGSLYEVYEPNDQKTLKPLGQFNQSRIIVRGNHIEHWLNGKLIVTAEAGSDEWLHRVAESKFAKVDGFGLNRYGQIMLTDHGTEVWYRNVVLQPLVAPELLYAAQPSRAGRSLCGARKVFSPGALRAALQRPLSHVRLLNAPQCRLAAKSRRR